MTANYHLLLDLNSYWRPGTGKGSGSHVDAVVDTDRFGCPFIGGRMLKGLLRDAVLRTQHWNSAGIDNKPTAETVAEILFGSWAYEELRPRHKTISGLIRLGDALLDDDVRRWLCDYPQHRQTLFRDIFSTAIDPEKGVARQGSLRGQQVVVPIQLRASLQVFEPEKKQATAHESWVYEHTQTIIATALPLIRAVGAGRTRGLGRATLTLEKVA